LAQFCGISGGTSSFQWVKAADSELLWAEAVQASLASLLETFAPPHPDSKRHSIIRSNLKTVLRSADVCTTGFPLRHQHAKQDGRHDQKDNQQESNPLYNEMMHQRNILKPCQNVR
jgi:hypothetical protein